MTHTHTHLHIIIYTYGWVCVAKPPTYMFRNRNLENPKESHAHGGVRGKLHADTDPSSGSKWGLRDCEVAVLPTAPLGT